MDSVSEIGSIYERLDLRDGRLMGRFLVEETREDESEKFEEDVEGNRWRILSALVADLLRELLPPSSVGTQHWATLRKRGLVDFMSQKGS